MENADTFIQEAKDLIKVCPVLAGKNAVEQAELGKDWCEQVAQWTDTVRTNKRYGRKIHMLINWSIQALQSKGSARKDYDELVCLLVSGYELIRKKAPAKKKLPGKIIDEPNAIGPLKAKDFATQAIKKIKDELSEPGRNWHLASFRGGGLVTTDPAVKLLLKRLDQSNRWLTIHLQFSGLGAGERVRFQKSFLDTIDSESEWTNAYRALEAGLKSLEARRAAPWGWLGVNLIGFSISPQYNVFEALLPNEQTTIRVKVTSGNIGPTPAFVYVVCQALGMVQEDFRAKKPAGTVRKIEPKEEDGQSCSGGNISGMRWQDARKKAERIVDDSGFRGFMKLKRAVGCSKRTLTRAIKESPKLTKERSQYDAMSSTLKAVGLTPKVLATYKEKSEGPQLTGIEVEEILDEMMQQVKEDKPAMLEQTELCIKNMSLTQKHDFAKMFQDEYKALKKHNRTPKKDEKRTFFSGPKKPRQHKKV